MWLGASASIAMGATTLTTQAMSEVWLGFYRQSTKESEGRQETLIVPEHLKRDAIGRFDQGCFASGE